MRRAPLLAAAAVLAASGCSRPGSRQRGPPERHLPGAAALSLVVPRLEPAARQLGALHRALAGVPALAQLDEAWAGLRAQLGFDPLEPAALARAGIDPAGGAGAALGGAAPLLVLPVADPASFDAMVLRLSRDRMGAGQRTTGVLSGHQVVSYRRDPKSPAALSYTIVDGYALLSAGEGGPAAAAAAAAQEEPRSLAARSGWARARAAVAGYPVVCFAPSGSPAAALLPVAGDAALGLRAGAAGLGVRAAVAAGRADALDSLAGEPGPARRAGAAEVALLAPDAALALRWGGDPAALGRRLLPRLHPRIAAALSAARIDLEHDLLGNVRPGAAASLSLAPTFTLAELASPRLDLRRFDPFRLVAVEALARVKDPAQARALFARVAEAAPRWGARVAARPGAGGATTWTLSYGSARFRWSLEGDRLAAAGGAGRLEALERRASDGEGGYRAPTALARGALETGVGGAVLDFDRLVSAVRALPDEAYGAGPNAFVMRSLAERFLEPASRLRATSLRFEVGEGAALLDLEIEGREAGAGQP